HALVVACLGRARCEDDGRREARGQLLAKDERSPGERRDADEDAGGERDPPVQAKKAGRRHAYWRITASRGVNLSPSACATAGCVTCPAATLRPSPKCTSSRSACFHPLSASARTYGSVALLSARVDVRATAPGMLATQ